MKKFLALLLALLMVFALAACGEDEKGIVGKWAFSYEMNGDDMGLPDFDGSIDVVFDVEFDKDGVCTIVVDMDALEGELNGLSKDLVDYMVQELYDELGGKAEAEELCQDEFGMSCEDYCEDEMDGFIDELMDEFEGLKEEAEYTYKDGVLELDGEELDCTIKGDKMTIEGSSDVIGIEDEKITLERK